MRNNRAGTFKRITLFIKLTPWLLHKKKADSITVYRKANSNQILCAVWGHVINESVLGFINLPEFLTALFLSHNLSYWKAHLFSECLMWI